jgi:hypothetical protein
MIAIPRRVPPRGAGLALLLAFALAWAPAWPIGQTLTLDELSRLLKVVDQRGSHTTIPQQVASVLQLQPAQHTPDIKEAAYLDDAGTKHGFGPLNDGSGYFMFRSGGSQGQTVYVVDPSLHLVRAARSLLVNGPLIPLPQDEAQRELDDEFHHWSKVLSPAGPSAPKDLKRPVDPMKPFQSRAPMQSTPPPSPSAPLPPAGEGR